MARGAESLASVRRERILLALRREGAIRLGEIAQELGVSVMTVRRDLQSLQREGLVQRVRGYPAAHHPHRHAWTRMCRPACQIESFDIGTGIGRLERSIPPPVTGKAVDRPMKHLVSLMDIDRRERPLEDNTLLNIGKPRGALQLVEDDLAVTRKDPGPIMFGM